MKTKDNKGIAIASTLFVMALLSIIGVTVLTLSLSQTRQSFYQERRVQAFYLAKTGAESVAKYILNNPYQAGDLLAAVNSDPNESFGSGTFEVAVLSGAEPGQIIIKGKGTVRDVVNTATLVLVKPDGASLIDKAIYTGESLNISGMKVNGDVQSGGDITYSTNGSNAFYDEAFPNEPRVIEVVWPDIPPANNPYNFEVKNQDFNIPGPNVTGTIGETDEGKPTLSYNFGTIEVAQNGRVNINTGTNIIRIFIDNLSIDNILNINAESGGRVEIYVRDTIIVKTKGIINNTTPHNLFIFLADAEKNQPPRFIIQANMLLNGYVIGPNATMEIQSAQSTINGAIIANLVQKNDNNGPNGEINYHELPTDLTLGNIIYEYRMVQWQ